jgi:Cu(I)/Ag(I) efflux system membrane protein CusA/SilA
MIAAIIRYALANRLPVLFAALLLAIMGTWSLLHTPIDALPDLSDTQVIIRTPWPGQTPQIVEDQLTYPLATTMLSVPGVTTVRAYSFFGDSFVYVLFDDGTDPYWARSRVLEYLSQARDRLPAGVSPALGPDATGVGWIYEYALVDRSGKHDLGELRSIQDWLLRFELTALPGVAEVASIGGMVRAWQIVPDPQRLRAQGIAVEQVIAAVRAANGAVGGSVIVQGEAEMMVASEGYLRTHEAFEQVPLALDAGRNPVLLGDVATIRRGPAFRRGIAELDGEGEVAGGVVVLRSGGDALSAIAAVKTRLAQLAASLPDGVQIVPTYDRSELIQAAVENLRGKLIEEFIVVAIVCVLFLWHLRSAGVALVTLPLGVLAAFIVMRQQGISANLMSLGGIAIAIGAMVDAAVVMVENAHKHFEHFREKHGRDAHGDERWRVVGAASVEVGPALAISLLIVTLSFVPVFALQAQEGRLFAPLAYTKTYAMAAAAGLSITLVPVLMGYLVRGQIRSEQRNPLNRFLIAIYRPLLAVVLRRPRVALAVGMLAIALSVVPALRLGNEFMPPLDEGTLLYMPTALPGLSAAKAGELLQLTDRMIRTVPEVAHVFGKAGRADSATDPAPLEMFETTITFKPRAQWRPGLTPAALRAELDAAVKVPGLSNLWVPPIRNRIDMLATGIKSPVGVKIAGPDSAQLQRLAAKVEALARTVPGVYSAIAERSAGGRYVDVVVDIQAAARYGLSQQAVQQIIATVVGGEPIGETIEGRERYPIVLRYPRPERDSLAALAELPIIADDGSQVLLSDIATLRLRDGPPALRSENAQLVTYVYVDVVPGQLGATVDALRERLAVDLVLPPGYSVSYSGQFEYLARAMQRLTIIVPVALVVIFLLIWTVFRRAAEALLIMLSLPFALVGGLWLIWLLGHAISVATIIGFLALAGVSAEFGVIMLLYLRQAWDRRLAEQPDADEKALSEAIHEGAVMRVRPKAMTVATILAGLFPILVGTGAGSEVMQRIAAPMVGGMLSAPLLSMLLLPAAFELIERRRLRQRRGR